MAKVEGVALQSGNCGSGVLSERVVAAIDRLGTPRAFQICSSTLRKADTGAAKCSRTHTRAQNSFKPETCS